MWARRVVNSLVDLNIDAFTKMVITVRSATRSALGRDCVSTNVSEPLNLKLGCSGCHLKTGFGSVVSPPTCRKEERYERKLALVAG